MFNRNYDDLSKRIEELECRLENHISAEKDILYEMEFECKLIPFDIFDLQINGKNLCRGCTKEYFPKLAHNIIGIKDVRISLRESLVDLIVEE